MTSDPSLQMTPVTVAGSSGLTDGPARPPEAVVSRPPDPVGIQGPPPPRRWRFGPRSLTGRLVTGVVALVVVLVLATGVGTYWELRSFLMNRLDQQVESTAGQALQSVFSRRLPNPGAQPIYLTQLSPSGEVLDKINNSMGSVHHMQLSASDRARLETPNTSPVSVTTTDGEHLRVVSTVQPDLAGVVVVGLSTDEVDRTLHRLLLLELVIGASAVIVAVFATTYGVQFSLRRLRRVTTTAHEVAVELSPDGAGLERRVPVSEADADTEVGQLATSFNTMMSTVETQFAARVDSERRMRQFLADASHELRTPLTSIRGYAELARMQRQSQSVPDADNLDRIESEGTRMSRLIDDLLLLARSDRDHAEGEAAPHELVDVADLLDDAVEGARVSYPGREITLNAPTGVAVLGDRDELLRAVRNLVTNAAVHTRADGPIEVRAARDQYWVEIQVVDAGPGLDPADAAHVFERFWRADKARTRARGGSGLGMAIVASIVHGHRGQVHFQSTVEGGSTVTVRLPVGTAAT